MSLQFNTSIRDTWLNSLNSAIGTSALLDLFVGAPPASCASADPATKLAELTCNVGGFGTEAGQVLTVSAIASVIAVGTGVAGCFRLKTSGGVVVMQGTVSTVGADLNITNTSINAGDTVAFTSWTITAPGA